MANIAVDATSNGERTSAGTSTTVEHTCSGTNRVLVVATAYVDASIVSGVTYDGSAMTKAVERNDGDYLNCQLWYIVNPSTGANDIVVTHSSSSTMKVLGVSFTGANTSDPVDVTGSEANAAGTDPDLAVTTNNANSYLIDVFSAESATMSVGASQTAIADLSGNSHQGGASYEAGGAAGSHTMSWGMTESKASAHCILAIKELPTINVEVTPAVLSATNSIEAPTSEAGTGVSFSVGELASSLSLQAPTIVEGQGITFSVGLVEGTFTLPTSIIEAIFWSKIAKNIASYSNVAKNAGSYKKLTKNTNTWKYQDKRT